MDKDIQIINLLTDKIELMEENKKLRREKVSLMVDKLRVMLEINSFAFTTEQYKKYEQELDEALKV